jgi:hypothetical protein
MNLNLKNFNSGDSIAKGINHSYFGIYGHTLFSGTRSTLKVEGIFSNKSLFHRSINRFFL